MGFNKITNKETKNGRSSEEQNRRTLKGRSKKYVELIFVLLSYVLL